VDTETAEHGILPGKSEFRSSGDGVRDMGRGVTALMPVYAESGVMMWPFTFPLSGIRRMAFRMAGAVRIRRRVFYRTTL